MEEEVVRVARIRIRDTSGWIRAALVVVFVAHPGMVASMADEGDEERTSYSLGHQIGMDLVRQGRSVDLDAVARGLEDGLSGQEPAYPPEELAALLVTLKREIVAAERDDRIRSAPTLRNVGLAYMEENARRDGVESHESGVQYRVIRPGKGTHPSTEDAVRIRYKSWRLDGQVFHDSTSPESEAETMRVGALIPGLREILPLMAEGARWEITIPPDLAFGRRGPLADQTVTYDLELLAVVKDEAAASEAKP